jgi:hypothetical protein
VLEEVMKFRQDQLCEMASEHFRIMEVPTPTNPCRSVLQKTSHRPERLAAVIDRAASRKRRTSWATRRRGSRFLTPRSAQVWLPGSA